MIAEFGHYALALVLALLLRHTNAEEGQMIHDPANAVAAASPSDTKLRRLLGGCPYSR
jgi:hypothetical protein